MISNIVAFVAESNRIEGIMRPPFACEVDATDEFLRLLVVSVADVQKLVSVLEPGAFLRDRYGMNVRVGNHVSPPGGRQIHIQLNALLVKIRRGELTPFMAHVQYERLHPFMDGNGRSGRALWAWQMLHQEFHDVRLGFLHHFYYQAIQGTKTLDTP